MSKYFKFNDRNTHIIKIDDFYYLNSYLSSLGNYTMEVVLEKKEKYLLFYEDKEIMKKDITRLTNFLNKNEVSK